MVTKEYFDDLQEEMANKSVEALVKEFNRQVGNTGWTSIRGLHDSVLVKLNTDKNKLIFV